MFIRSRTVCITKSLYIEVSVHVLGRIPCQAASQCGDRYISNSFLLKCSLFKLFDCNRHASTGL